MVYPKEPTTYDFKCASLFTIDVSNVVSNLQMYDQFTTKVYEWVGRNITQHKDFKQLVKAFNDTHLIFLQSHGQVLESILHYMLVILDVFQVSTKTYWYNYATSH
jgi:hypothetical protein